MKELSQNRFQKQIRFWACALVLATACLHCTRLPFIFQPPLRRAEPVPAPSQESASVSQEIPPASSETPAMREESLPPPMTETERPTSLVEPEAPPKQAPSSPPYYHSVNWAGETLSIIAAWYTGDGKNWKELARANLQVNPNLIRWGDEILIPEQLLKTREPLPKAFVEKYYHKPIKATPIFKSQPARAQEDEPDLFGPKKNF